MLKGTIIISIITLIQQLEATLLQGRARQEFGKDLAHCLLDILNRNFPTSDPIAIQLPTIYFCEKIKPYTAQDDDVFFTTFNNGTLNQQVIFGCYSEGDLRSENYRIKPATAIIMLPDTKLKFLIYHMQIAITQIEILLGYRGVPVVIVSTQLFTSEAHQRSLALALFNRAWTYLQVEDVIIVMPRRIGRLKYLIDVYSWTPESQRDHCLRDLSEVTLLDTWSSEENRFLKNTSLFQKKEYFSSKLYTQRCIVPTGTICIHGYIQLSKSYY